MSKFNSYDTKSSSFNTLDRELSVNESFIPSEKFREMSIQSNSTNSANPTNSANSANSANLPNSDKSKQYQTNSDKSKQYQTKSAKPKQINTKPQKSNFSDRPMPSESVEPSMEKKLKYYDVSNRNFVNFYSKGNKLGQNYNTEQENDLRFSESTRRKTLPKTTTSVYKNASRDVSLDSINNNYISSNDKFISDLVTADSNLRPNTSISNEKIMSINSNLISDNAAKVLKASPEYWDNTRRRNLDTAIYTNLPKKIQGRGFGDIDSYDLFLNGVGAATRQDNPDKKPQNTEDDRIFMTNHNYNYDKHHVTPNLPCGADTRYLNKKML